MKTPFQSSGCFSCDKKISTNANDIHSCRTISWEFHLCTEIIFHMLLWLKWHIFNAYFCKFEELLPYTHQQTHTHSAKHSHTHNWLQNNFDDAHMHQMDLSGYSHSTFLYIVCTRLYSFLILHFAFRIKVMMHYHFTDSFF